MDSEGRSLLHYAAQRGSIKRVKFLVAHSLVEIALPDHKQRTAFDYAATHVNLKVSNYLIQTKVVFPGHPDINQRLCHFVNLDTEEQILLAIYVDNCEVFKKLIMHYVKNINGYLSTLRYYGMTLASVCCAEFSTECLQFLIMLGADINRHHWIVAGFPLKECCT